MIMGAEVGMLIVETIAKIRRAFFGQGRSIKAICRELRVSRKVVRKVIRSKATEFRYEREAQPLPKVGPWRDKLDQLLLANEGKASRERLTLIRLFEELRGCGYDGGYDAVRRYARQWSKERGQATAAAYVPLSFAPGEAFQFDWSHEVVLLGGVTVIVKVAHVRLCHSRMLFVRAYPRETQEMVFDAHDRAFVLFKGACGRGIYDNMKTAVETVFVGKQRLYNRRFLQMCSHYLIEPVACTPASGWEKGQVENQVGLVRERFFTDKDATTGAELAPGSGSWSMLSDRNAKENFARTNPREVLDKLASLPLATWNYKAQGEAIRHIGPVAQDFHAAFGVGEDERRISSVDADGVALAAIQGLNQKVEQENRALRAELDAKEVQIQELKKGLAGLRELIEQRSTTQR